MICANCAGPTATPGLCLNCARIANMGRRERMAKAFAAAVDEQLKVYAGGGVDSDTHGAETQRGVTASRNPAPSSSNRKPVTTPARQQPIKPQRVRFGPGEVPISEAAWQRKERQQEAYYDAMEADVTGAYQWPTRECAGGCGRNVSGPWDKCARCEERHELEHEEASNQ